MKFKQFALFEKAIEEVGGLRPMVVKSHHKLMTVKIPKSLTGLTVLMLL